MRKYNPDKAPDAAAWLALDETERIELVKQAHKDTDLDFIQLTLHATSHVTIETQIAMNLEHVVSNFDRLIKEGLGRHDAIHACAAISMELIYKGMNGDGKEDLEAFYKKRLGELTAKNWLDQTY